MNYDIVKGIILNGRPSGGHGSQITMTTITN